MTDQKATAKKLFLSGKTMKAIALKLGVSTKTIQRWCHEGAWKEERAVNVIPMVKPTKHEPIEPLPPPPVRKLSGKINELEIVDLALADLSAVLGGRCDPRSLGSIATGICRLIELRLRLKPRTAAEVAEMAIDLGIKPQDFVVELRDKWQHRA